MSENENHTVSIEIENLVFKRYADLRISVSQAIAEFIDNALQSYRDNKEYLQSLDPNFEFRVSVDFKWQEQSVNSRSIEVCIADNAGGMTYESFSNAFKTAWTPKDNSGLNEFGMGMKTAACWLGSNWTIETTPIGEPYKRLFSFSMDDVVGNNKKYLPYEEKPADLNQHFTIVRISDLNQNAPSRRYISRLKQELASIYRCSLRNNEMQLYVEKEKLDFKEYEILNARFYKEKEGPLIYWKKEIDFKFNKYRAKGFIAILKDIKSTNNGLVLLRRGRVIRGASEDERYFPKVLFGSTGNFRYKRLFGELELEGFNVSFNKNDIQDKENLEALMYALKDEIHSKDFDLYNQAEEYRVDTQNKRVSHYIKEHDKQSKTTKIPIEIDATRKKVSNENKPVQHQTINETKVKDTYKIGGQQYSLTIQFVNGDNSELFWLDLSKESENELICKIDNNHSFFTCFNLTDAVVTLIKTLVVAKYTAIKFGNDTTSDLFSLFNDYIQETKV